MPINPDDCHDDEPTGVCEFCGNVVYDHSGICEWCEYGLTNPDDQAEEGDFDLDIKPDGTGVA